jgi:hypothetical protein
MAKVGIYTVVAHRADFIAWQFYSLRHLHDPWEYTVLCNAEPDDPLRDRIHWQCYALGVRCVDVQGQNHSTANWHHARAMEFGWHEAVLPDAPDIAVWLDFDCFAFRPFSFANWLEGFAMGGKRSGHNYFWPGLLALDLRHLPDPETLNFNCGEVDGVPVDVGGMILTYLEAHPELPLRAIKGEDIMSAETALELFGEGYDPAWSSWILAGSWLHYANGTNWRRWPKEIEEAKTMWLRRVLQ